MRILRLGDDYEDDLQPALSGTASTSWHSIPDDLVTEEEMKEFRADLAQRLAKKRPMGFTATWPVEPS